MIKKNIECPWDAKGKVMRVLTSEKTNNNVESYKSNAKPGSLASKANMVKKYNDNKK